MRIRLIKLFKEKQKNFIVLDIGETTIKVLFFKKNKRRIDILESTQEYLDQFEIFNSQDFKADILKKAISAVFEELEKKTGQRPKGIFLGLPVNVLRADFLLINFLRKKPKKKINKREEEELKKEIFEKAKKEISQKFESDSGILAKEIHFLSLKILEIKIDGYSLPKIQGYNGRILEVRVLILSLSKYSLDYYLKIFQNFGIPILSIGHYAQILDGIFDTKNALFIDIGGETTQFFLVKNKILEVMDKFEIGGNFFSKILSENLGISRRDSRLLKEKYSRGKLSEGLSKRIKEIFTPAINDWFSKLKFELKKSGSLLPSEIFLFGGGSLLPDFENVLEKGDWEDLSFLGKVRPKLLLPKDLKNIGNIEKINSPQSTSVLLLLLSFFFNNYG